MYKIVRKKVLNPTVTLMEIDAPMVAKKAEPGQFIILRVDEDGERIPLTAKEYELLSVLSRNSGRIVTIDALCEAVWGDNPYGYENSLMAHIRRIREKIEQDPSHPVSLVTVKGLGYKLIPAKSGQNAS